MTVIQSTPMRFLSVRDVYDSNFSIMDLVRQESIRVGNYWFSVKLTGDVKKGIQVVGKVESDTGKGIVMFFNLFLANLLHKPKPKLASVKARANQLSDMLSDLNRMEIEKRRRELAIKRLDDEQFKTFFNNALVPPMFESYCEKEELHAAIYRREPNYESARRKYQKEWE